jgi:hypothetical protein
VVVAVGGIAAALLVSYFCFFFYRDNFSTHYPIKFLSAEAYRAGEIPYWNFADAGGQPLAGNPNALTFYPDNILYLFLPVHVAFNLHFLIHLAVAYFAMRAVTRSSFGGALYALSGVAISATAFYNLIVAVAMLPLAFLAVERRRPLLLGLALGLVALAGEPVTLLAVGISVAIVAVRRVSLRDLLIAGALAAVIVSPQVIAYSEIAREVERAAGMSVKTVLNTSLHPMYLAEIAFAPLRGFLNDPGGARDRLFSTIFLGLIAIPALARRSRYLVVVLVMFFFALGRYNPLFAAVVANMPFIRIVRFPEKFILAAIGGLVVLSSDFYRDAKWKPAWVAITFVPLLWSAARAIPLDVFAPYRVERGEPRRIYYLSSIPPGTLPAPVEYRRRAKALEPIFGATAGLTFAVNPSPDGMHALRSRMVLERFAGADKAVRAKYLRMQGTDIAGALPAAYFPDRMIRARNIYEEAGIVESPVFNEQTDVVVPMEPFASAAARVSSYSENGQTIEVSVESAGRALLIVNQTFFAAWKATSPSGELVTIPVNVDRLGIIVPPGQTVVTLQFGRQRAAVAVAWAASSLALLFIAGAYAVEKFNGRAGKVQRPGDDGSTALRT